MVEKCLFIFPDSLACIIIRFTELSEEFMEITSQKFGAFYKKIIIE
jgi:hypothetical protein